MTTAVETHAQPHATPKRTRVPGGAAWAVIITGLALFMASLDNLVVTTALPVIRVHLHAGLSGLEWTVNAYTLTFAVLLLSAAAIGERFGRRRVFTLGIAVFTVASAVAALAPSIGVLIAARAVQGAGGAMVMPLSLTLLSAAVLPAASQCRTRNLGSDRRRRRGRRAARRRRGHDGVVLAVHLLAQRADRDRPDRLRVVEARRNPAASTATGPAGCRPCQCRSLRRGLRPGRREPAWLDQYRGITSFVVGAIGLVAFARWELRTTDPMLPLRLFRNRAFAAVNVTAMLFSFGMFGSVFFLSQFLQTVQGYSPLGAGLRILPWTGIIWSSHRWSGIWSSVGAASDWW